jgi:hypothetical protein
MVALSKLILGSHPKHVGFAGFQLVCCVGCGRHILCYGLPLCGRLFPENIVRNDMILRIIIYLPSYGKLAEIAATESQRSGGTHKCTKSTVSVMCAPLRQGVIITSN